MLLSILGLIFLALMGNMAFYEYRVQKPTKDIDLMSGYLDLERMKKR